ncbi:hypothetical protein MMC10_007562 [Thelotrema lepadinum]|nr:hypothetical protein [Thelotrema lepadinum]
MSPKRSPQRPSSRDMIRELNKWMRWRDDPEWRENSSDDILNGFQKVFNDNLEHNLQAIESEGIKRPKTKKVKTKKTKSTEPTKSPSKEPKSSSPTSEPRISDKSLQTLGDSLSRLGKALADVGDQLSASTKAAEPVQFTKLTPKGASIPDLAPGQSLAGLVTGLGFTNQPFTLRRYEDDET